MIIKNSRKVFSFYSGNKTNSKIIYIDKFKNKLDINKIILSKTLHKKIYYKKIDYLITLGMSKENSPKLILDYFNSLNKK